MTKMVCRWVLMIALPITVAPKKVEKGTKKWPHVMPAKSKKGFGTYNAVEQAIKFIGIHNKLK